jgi:peptide/nickel transport system substrate-binding protein
LTRLYSSRLHNGPNLGTAGFWLNTRLAPFNDLRVRQALNYAVDRNRLVAIAGGPAVSQVTCQWLAPNMNGYRRYCPYTRNPDAAGTYNGPDLAKARRLVAASGTKGQPVTVWAPDIRIGRLNGAYFVSVLRRLGYEARFQTFPAKPPFWKSDRQSGVAGWGVDYPSTNNFFEPVLTCGFYTPDPKTNSNYSAFCNHSVDAEIARAHDLQTSDPASATRLWSRIDRQITDQAPWVPMRTDLVPDLVSRRTGNYIYCFLSFSACLDQLWVR